MTVLEKEGLMLIVAGFDGSDHGWAALRRADQLARDLGADLHVVMVAYVPTLAFAGLANPLDVDLEAEMEAQLQYAFDQFAPELGTDPDVAILRGHPANAILEYIRNEDADLVVLGSRGRGDVASILLGSTSHQVLHRAACDVLIVKHEEDVAV